MKFNKLSLVSITVLLVVNFSLIFLMYSQMRDKKSKSAILASRQDRINGLEQKLGILKVLTINNVKAPIYNPCDPFFKDKVSGNALVLRFHENDCNDCVKQSIQTIVKYKKTNPETNFVVVADYSNMAKLNRDFPFIPVPVYLVENLNLDIEGNKSPYIFLIKNNRYEKVFFPNYLAMDMLDAYLKTL